MSLNVAKIDLNMTNKAMKLVKLVRKASRKAVKGSKYDE